MINGKKRISLALAVMLAVYCLVPAIFNGWTLAAYAASTAVTVDDNFNSHPAGPLSDADWKLTTLSSGTVLGTIEVVQDPSDPENKQLKATKTNATGSLIAERRNLSQTGKIVISYRVKSDELAGNKSAPYIYNETSSVNAVSISFDAGSIKAYNGSSNKTIQPFTAGTWYKIQLVLDTSTSKFDMHIDGKLMASQFAFRQETSGITFLRFALGSNHTGTIYVDDLQVSQTPAGISMDNEYHLSVGHPYTASITASYADGTSNEVTRGGTYSSSNPAVVKVDADGTLTGIGAGMAILTAQYAGETTSSTVTVTEGAVLNALQLEPSSFTLGQGAARSTVVTAVYSDGGRDVTAHAAYTSDNPAIASVGPTGFVTGLIAGTTVINAVYGGKTATATVTVIPVVSTVLLDNTAYELLSGDSHRMTATVIYSDQTREEVSAYAAYTSADPAIADVDMLGTITGKRAGVTVITAAYGGRSASATVSVSSIHLDSQAYVLQPSAEHKTAVYLLGPQGMQQDITANTRFASSNPAVAHVDKDGTVTAISVGTTEIQAIYGDHSLTAAVTVAPVGQATLVTLPSKGAEELQVQLWAEDVDDLYGVQSRLTFDPAVLQLRGVSPGSLFSGTAQPAAVDSSVYWDQGAAVGFVNYTLQNDQISYAATRIGQGVSGRQLPFITLDFQVLDESQDTILQVLDTFLTSWNNGAIQRAGVKGIKVTFGGEIVIPPEPPLDTEAPSEPVVTVTGKTATSVSLAWTASTDNVGISEYEVYKNGSKIAGTMAIAYTATGLSADQEYTFTVLAKDAAGNVSSGRRFVVRTLAAGEPDNGSSNGNDGGNTDTGSGNGTIVSPPAEGWQTLTLEQLKQHADSRGISLELADGIHELRLPAAGVSDDAQQKLTFHAPAASVTISGAALQELRQLVAGTSLQQSQIVYSLQALSTDAALKLLPAPASNIGDHTDGWKIASKVVQIALSQLSPTGNEVSLEKGRNVIDIRIPYESTGIEEQLLGLYRYDELTGLWSYAGGRVDVKTHTLQVQNVPLGTYAVMEFNKTYQDVPGDHWALQAIKILSARQIASGQEAASFAPDAYTTRAEFAAFLTRAIGLTAGKQAPFKDVAAGDWFVDEVSAAYEAKLIEGRNDEIFAPDEQLSRQEMAVMLVRALEYVKGHKLEVKAGGSFSDITQASDWAVSFIEAAASTGLLSGTGNGIFLPERWTNRAETAQAIYNLLLLEESLR